MKFIFGVINCGLLVALCIFISLPSEILTLEMCKPSNCVPADDCDEPVAHGFCPDSGVICCSVLKVSARKLCHHHGGICMTSCGQALMRDSTDCTDGSVCCVLV